MVDHFCAFTHFSALLAPTCWANVGCHCHGCTPRTRMKGKPHGVQTQMIQDDLSDMMLGSLCSQLYMFVSIFGESWDSPFFWGTLFIIKTRFNLMLQDITSIHSYARLPCIFILMLKNDIGQTIRGFVPDVFYFQYVCFVFLMYLIVGAEFENMNHWFHAFHPVAPQTMYICILYLFKSIPYNEVSRRRLHSHRVHALLVMTKTSNRSSEDVLLWMLTWMESIKYR